MLNYLKVLGSSMNQVFKMDGHVESIVDEIRAQWRLYQLEDIPSSFYLNEGVDEKSGV